MSQPRRYPCARPSCPRQAVKLGGFCSRSCNRRWHWNTLTPASARSAQMRHARRLQQQQQINRMIQRVMVLGETERDRLVLAWRYGKGCLKSATYRQRQQGV